MSSTTRGPRQSRPARLRPGALDRFVVNRAQPRSHLRSGNEALRQRACAPRPAAGEGVLEHRCGKLGAQRRGRVADNLHGMYCAG